MRNDFRREPVALVAGVGSAFIHAPSIAHLGSRTLSDNTSPCPVVMLLGKSPGASNSALVSVRRARGASTYDDEDCSRVTGRDFPNNISRGRKVCLSQS